MPKKEFQKPRPGNWKGRWRAQLKHRGIQVYLGVFDTWEEAKQVEDAYRTRHGLRPYRGQMVRSRAS
jgi:hypothetical protein